MSKNQMDYKSIASSLATLTTERISNLSFGFIMRSFTGLALLAGTLMVFHTLIEAAQARHMVNQLVEFKMDVNTFKVKYGYLPGDISRSAAAAFGMFVETGQPAPGHQDGNGLIEGGERYATAPVGETLLFWRHLVETHLVSEESGLTDTIPIDAKTGQLVADIAPPVGVLAKTGSNAGLYWIAYGASSRNYLQLLRVSRITHTGNYELNAHGMSPNLAATIDTKVDDGMPDTGLVQARGLSSVNEEPGISNISGAGACLISKANEKPAYDIDVRFDKVTEACSLRISLE